jgi:hypothetical protein
MMSIKHTMSSRLLAAVFATALSLQGSWAKAADGTYTNVTVTSIQVRNSGIAYVDFSPLVRAGGASPACSGSAQTIFTFDASTEIGKALLSTVIAAFLGGKAVYARSNGTCLAGYEELERFQAVGP